MSIVYGDSNNQADNSLCKTGNPIGNRVIVLNTFSLPIATGKILFENQSAPVRDAD